MVDLKAKPFYLNDEKIKWVEDTIRGMSLDEKIGQLFVLHKATPGMDEEKIKSDLAKYNQGGHRWQGGNAETAYEQNKFFQMNSKFPLFIATNCDDGGIGAAPEGTFVATAAECGAGEGTAKHFPGDGVEELDQHLALGVNNLSVDEWEKSFGHVYRTLIEEGLETIMVGHIALPEMTRKLRPGIEDKDIKPATLSPELLTDLLREHIKAAIEKLTGKSEFKGKADESVFCGRWDTRL